MTNENIKSLINLCKIALEDAENYMENQYDGYFREINEGQRKRVEMALSAIRNFKLQHGDR